MGEKIGYLDGLRGVAALVVVFLHFVLSFYPSMTNGDPRTIHLGSIEVLMSATPVNLLYNGNFAVCIFFILSGFVLTFKFFKSGKQEWLKSGIIRRYFRLLPVVVTSILAVFVFLMLSLFYDGTVKFYSGGSLLGVYSMIQPRIQDALSEAFFGVFINGSHSYNNVLWTMQIEFYGSLMAFVFAMFFRGMKNRWIIYLALAAALWNSYYLAFVLGVLLSDLYSQYGEKFRINSKLLLTELLLIGLFLGSYNYIGNHSYNLYTRLLPWLGSIDNSTIFYHVSGAFLLMVALLCSETLKNLFGGRIPMFLGKISFAMYAFHEVVILSFSCFLFLVLSKIFMYNEAVLITLAVSLPVIIAIAYLGYRYVDQPGIRLSRGIYTILFSDEQQTVDWKATWTQASAFARKNIVLLIIVNVVIILATGAFVFVEKPLIDQNTAMNSYNTDLRITHVAFETLAAYPPINNSSSITYSSWLKDYKSKQYAAAVAFTDLHDDAEIYQAYLKDNPAEARAVEDNVSMYQRLLNASYNKTIFYEKHNPFVV